MEDEDEVLVALAEELGNFEEYVGGSQFAQVLLAPLQHLATVEEPLVRHKVTRSSLLRLTFRPLNLSVRFVSCFLRHKLKNSLFPLSEPFLKPIGLLRVLQPLDYTPSCTIVSIHQFKIIYDNGLHNCARMIPPWSEESQLQTSRYFNQYI